MVGSSIPARCGSHASRLTKKKVVVCLLLHLSLLFEHHSLLPLLRPAARQSWSVDSFISRHALSLSSATPATSSSPVVVSLFIHLALRALSSATSATFGSSVVVS